MQETGRRSLSMDWGASTAYSANLRVMELVDRIWWFITMRWLAVLGCFVGHVLAALAWLPAQLNPGYFLVAAIFLAVTNLVYRLVARNLLDNRVNARGVVILLWTQMFNDFLILSLITYACGSIETPIVILFLPHIILATLFFRRAHSLLITVEAWVFASLPLALEGLGWIPTLTIFESYFKQEVNADMAITAGYVVGIGLCYLVSWYLVSEITTSLKLREAQLEEAFSKMNQMDREKTQATLRATHELKAPFAAIKSFVYTLRDGYCGELPEKAQKVVARIGERCDQLTERITDIIHLSNLRTLVLSDMDFREVDLMGLLKEEIEEANLMAEPRGISVQTSLESETAIFIMGSRPHLHTLFSNLIRNAIKYSHDESAVEISVKNAPGHVSVRVSDHGIGIPEKAMDRIFDEHFRCNNAVRHCARGTGIGLAMVKEIVKLHGAVIHVGSVEGKGTQFTVSFDTIEKTQPGRES